MDVAYAGVDTVSGYMCIKALKKSWHGLQINGFRLLIIIIIRKVWQGKVR